LIATKLIVDAMVDGLTTPSTTFTALEARKVLLTTLTQPEMELVLSTPNT